MIEVQAGPGAPTSKAEHAYNVIRHGIVGGEFTPGLPSRDRADRP